MGNKTNTPYRKINPQKQPILAPDAFILQAFTERLLCGGHCSAHWDQDGERHDPHSLCPTQLPFGESEGNLDGVLHGTVASGVPVCAEEVWSGLSLYLGLLGKVFQRRQPLNKVALDNRSLASD